MMNKVRFYISSLQPRSQYASSWAKKLGNEVALVHMECLRTSLYVKVTLQLRKPFSLLGGALRLWHAKSEGREGGGDQLQQPHPSPLILRATGNLSATTLEPPRRL